MGSAFNYPFQLTLVPLIGAIAAGCTAVIKPSEMSPYSAAVMVRILEQALDPDSYAIVNGGVEETTELLKHKWDKIMYYLRGCCETSDPGYIGTVCGFPISLLLQAPITRWIVFWLQPRRHSGEILYYDMLE
jgi:hypothetical protein